VKVATEAIISSTVTPAQSIISRLRREVSRQAAVVSV
jgi:hypothetical protein